MRMSAIESSVPFIGLGWGFDREIRPVDNILMMKEDGVILWILI